MRPFILDPLFQSVQRLSGIGPRFAKVLEKLVGPCVVDLLFHLPVSVVDRRVVKLIADVTNGQTVTIKARVTSLALAQHSGRPSKITVSDPSGDLALIFFKNPGNYLQNNLPLGREVVISGRVEFYNGRPQMPHPDKIGSMDDLDKIAQLEPIYPMTAGLSHGVLSKTIMAALNKLPDLPEWQSADVLQAHSFPAWRTALTMLHHPQQMDHIAPTNPARRRLAYDEILSHQLALAITREKQKALGSTPLTIDQAVITRVLAQLPFTLTAGQQQILQQIEQDLQQPYQMCRLLQGDVGSGKTIIAFIAAAMVVAAGKQAAIMAPTEILARQHYMGLRDLSAALGLRMALLTAREKGKARQIILDDLVQGRIDILIGTHAIIQDPVRFHNLGLAVIDEQHRFGVAQRLALAEKGQAVNILVMTATPIPRTLALTAYGDMDVSALREKPAGRLPIDTRVLPHDRIPDIVAGLKRKLESGDRIYWVCPLVEESELIDLSAAEDRYAALLQIFPGRVGLIHGRMKGDDKDAVMHRFINGDIDILVATTVIEVGVNVPEATVMIIEHAERFGLSQLHQLRGRVGRGTKGGTCLLLYESPLGKVAKQRLETLRQTEDGFSIAEMDLTLRGAGDVLGTKQSGDMAFRLADIAVHHDLLEIAHKEAKLILHHDPLLTSERGKNLRLLLHLFEREQADRFLTAG